MNNFQFEENKLFSIKDKSLMKDFSSIFKQNLSKKYKKSTNIQINQDKSKLEKSTKKANLNKNNKNMKTKDEKNISKEIEEQHRLDTKNSKKREKKNSNSSFKNLKSSILFKPKKIIK